MQGVFLGIRISAVALKDPEFIQPHRIDFDHPNDHRAECPLGRLRLRNIISEAEYQAGCRWREIYHNWLRSIYAPDPFGGGEQLEPKEQWDDEMCEDIARAAKLGVSILKQQGTRVFHATNAIVVYEEPEELGEDTAMAAKVGLAALARVFG